MVQEDQIISHNCAQVILRPHYLARVDCLPLLQKKGSALKYQSQKSLQNIKLQSWKPSGCKHDGNGPLSFSQAMYWWMCFSMWCQEYFTLSCLFYVRSPNCPWFQWSIFTKIASQCILLFAMWPPLSSCCGEGSVSTYTEFLLIQYDLMIV